MKSEKYYKLESLAKKFPGLESNISEEYFSLNKIGYLIVDFPEEKIITINKIGLGLLGYSKTEIIGEKISKIFKSNNNIEIQLDWKNFTLPSVGIRCKNRTTLYTDIQTIKLKVKKGENKRVMIVLKNHSSKGKSDGNTLISERKLKALQNRELKYRTLVEQLFDGIALINKKGDIEIWNSKLLEMLGYNEVDIKHTNLKDTFSGEVKGLTKKQDFSKNKKGYISFESKIIRKNGSNFPAEINLRFLDDNTVMLAIKDISDKKSIEEMREKLLDKLVEAQNVMKTLSRKLMQVQEAERRNIARELHDEIGQTLTAIKIDIMNALKYIPASDIQGQLKDTIQLVESTLNNVRELSLKLRPSILDDLGLIPALRWYIDRQVQRTGINAKVITKQTEIKLPSEFQIASYRIIQEAVNNIIKHSQAKNMTIEVDARLKELHITIIDDGIGYDVVAARKNASGGLSVGVLSMQERAELVGGWMDIYSKPGKGTTIHAIFPYKKDDQ